jgi:hypothetical protein
MYIFSLNIAFRSSFIFIFFREVRIIILFSFSCCVILGLATAIHEIEFSSVSCSKKGVRVFASLHVNSIKLSDSGVLVDDLAIAEETPNLSKSHGETFF